MKEEFTEYLEAIGITKPLREKIETFYEFCERMCPDEITGIFITEHIGEDGVRVHENLWFLSEKFSMEAKQFITKDDFDITPIQKRIFYWTIQKQDYDFKKATGKSRLYLTFRLDTGIRGEFKASKENCDYLKDILVKYIVPNLKE